METAKIWAKRGTCPRASVGAVISRKGRIISVGYVGAPPKERHCTEVGCLIEKETNSCVRGIHSEMNAIGFAARYGISTIQSEMFVTLSPCLRCAQAIIAAGIEKVIYLDKYKDPRGIKYLEDNGVFVISMFEILGKGGERE